MPKKIERWSCSKCREEFKNEGQAEACERKHITDLSIFKPDLYFDKGKNYPYMIILHLGGQDRAIYKLYNILDNADGA